MKILMTTDNLGGVWTFSTDLAKGLKKYGIEVVLAITGTPLTFAQKEKLEGVEYFFEPFHQEWMDNAWEDMEMAGQWLMKINKLVSPDLVHLNTYSWGKLDWNVPVVMTLHSCVLSWWEAVKKEPAPEKWSVYKQHVASGMQAADVLTAPSRTMLRAAETHYGPFSNAKVIYNGRNGSRFTQAEKESFVFSMGRLWDEAKNIRLLVEAAKNIRYPIYIAGDQPPELPVEQAENIYFTGLLNQEEIAGWLSKAAVYALPVRYEPFGYTFLEAAFAGCALVGGNIRSMHEIWGDAMLYTDPDDPEQLAEAINHLLENEEKRNRLSTASFPKAHERYTLGRMLEQYEALYREAAMAYQYSTVEAGRTIKFNK